MVQSRFIGDVDMTPLFDGLKQMIVAMGIVGGEVLTDAEASEAAWNVLESESFHEDLAQQIEDALASREK